MQLSDIVILSGARTPIGSFGGALASQSPAQLGTMAATAAISRAGVDAAAVDLAVFGHIITTTSDDVYLARQIALQSGMATSSNAFQVNRLCGSGLQAIISAAQQLLLGQEQCLPVTGQCRQVIALGKVVIRQPGMLPPLGHGILSRHLCSIHAKH